MSRTELRTFESVKVGRRKVTKITSMFSLPSGNTKTFPFVFRVIFEGHLDLRQHQEEPPDSSSTSRDSERKGGTTFL